MKTSEVPETSERVKFIIDALFKPKIIRLLFANKHPSYEEYYSRLGYKHQEILVSINCCIFVNRFQSAFNYLKRERQAIFSDQKNQNPQKKFDNIINREKDKLMDMLLWSPRTLTIFSKLDKLTELADSFDKFSRLGAIEDLKLTPEEQKRVFEFRHHIELDDNSPAFKEVRMKIHLIMDTIFKPKIIHFLFANKNPLFKKYFFSLKNNDQEILADIYGHSFVKKFQSTFDYLKHERQALLSDPRNKDSQKKFDYIVNEKQLKLIEILLDSPVMLTTFLKLGKLTELADSFDEFSHRAVIPKTVTLMPAPSGSGHKVVSFHCVRPLGMS